MRFSHQINGNRPSPRAQLPQALTRSAFAVLLLLTVSGCDVLGGSGTTRSGIEHDVVVHLAEQHGFGADHPDEPRLVFSMRTEEELPCMNYKIRYDLDRTRDRVSIRAREIVRPAICLTALGPARASFELPLEQGAYDLVLLNGPAVDRYTVTVTETAVELEPRNTSWTRPASRLNWKFPRDSFAFYCGTLTETKSLCTDFEARLKNLSLTSLEVPEVGQWPYALSSQGHYYDAPARFYRYPDAATWDEVKERLRTFTRERLTDQEGTGLQVRNWLGDAVRSWMVDDL